MSRLVKIIIIIIAAFILLSLCLYKLQLGRNHGAPHEGKGATFEATTVEEAEGEVGAVDEESRTLTLINNSRSMAFSFDDKTSVMQAGRLLRPASIKPGARATVKYQKRGRRLLAREIVIVPPSPY
jgi:hypothetical protein